MSSKDDKQRFALNISVKDRTVYMDFPEPVNWIAMDKEMTLQVANILIQHAKSIKDKSKEH